jgi:hypothetical protein
MDFCYSNPVAFCDVERGAGGETGDLASGNAPAVYCDPRPVTVRYRLREPRNCITICNK